MSLAAIAVRLEGVDAETALARAEAACNGPEEVEQDDFIRELARREAARRAAR